MRPKQTSVPPIIELNGNPVTSLTALLSQRILAIGLLCFLGYAALNYPVGNPVLMVGLAIYLIIIFFYSYAWLLLLPIVLAWVNLAPWSGRLLFEEFDLFLLATVIGGFWHGRYRLTLFIQNRRIMILLILSLCFSYSLSLFKGLLPLLPLDFNALASYENSYNSLRIGRGFFWSILLLPLLLHELTANSRRTCKQLCLGMTVGVIGVGIMVLWERGVFADLVHARNIYAALGGLLNFSTSYRITGLFSEMHTGGAAIDGYLILAWPFSLSVLILFHNRLHLQVLGLLGLGFGCYAILVTFTRMTYIAFFVSMLAYLILLRRAKPGLIPIKIASNLGLLISLSSACFYYGFAKGGILALAGCVFSFLGGSLSNFGRLRLSKSSGWLIVIILLSSGGYVLVDALLTSKWVKTPWVEAVPTAVGLVILLAWTGWRFSYEWLKFANQRALAISLVVLLGVTALSVTVLANYRMEARFSAVTQDSKTRLDHWHKVLTAIDQGWENVLFGMGLGSFPRRYLISNPAERKSVGSYRISYNQSDSYLSIGVGSDLGIGQRISGLLSNRSYQLSLDARSDTPTKLGIELCRRNILYSERWQGSGCEYFNLAIPGATWQQLQISIDSGSVAQGQWYERWPVVLMLRHLQGAAIIDIDNIALHDELGYDYINNGNFSAGLDHWFAYNDFSHLPWHVKNLWLNIYFDQGSVGVIVLLCTLLYVFYACLKTPHGMNETTILSITLLTSIMGFLILGFAENPLDIPRIMVFFYLFIFSAMVNHLLSNHHR